MARILSDKVLLGVAGACYFLVILLAFVPGPRLLIRSDFRYMSGNWYSGPPTTGSGQIQMFSSGALNPDSWQAPTRTSELASALERNHRALTFGKPEEPALRSLELYCDAHPSDAEAWAHLARMATQSCQPSSDPAKISRNALPRWDRARRLILKASEAGMRLEPSNSYFALMHAGAQMASASGRNALDEYLAASNLAFYRDYSFAEADTISKAVEENHGDISSLQKWQIQSQVLLPHCAFIKSLSKLIVERSPGPYVETRRALCRVAVLMMDAKESAITSLVGASIFNIAIGKSATPKQLDESEQGGFYRSIEAKSVRLKQTLASWDQPATQRFFEESGRLVSWRPRFGAALMACLITSPIIALAIGWAATRKLGRARSGTQSIWPHIAILAAMIGAVGVLVLSARLPQINLLFMIALATIAAALIGAMFAPAARIDLRRFAAGSAILCTLLLGVTLILDARVEASARQYLEKRDELERITADSTG